jgi:nitroreductase
MPRTVPANHPIDALLTQRFSPYVFDPERSVERAELASLFEAARWTMSCYNEQPWRYIVGVRDRDPETWDEVLGVLVESNQVWARNAPVLALGVIQLNFERNGEPNPVARHDLGAASANLTVEASSRGLFVHQMLGILPDKARAVFDLPDSLEAVTGIAIGHLGDPAGADPELAARDQRARERRPVREFIIRGGL